MAESPTFQAPPGDPAAPPGPAPARRGRRAPHQPVRDEPVFVRWLDDAEVEHAVAIRGWRDGALDGFRLAWFTSPDWQPIPDDADVTCCQQTTACQHRAVAEQVKLARIGDDGLRRGGGRPRPYCRVHMGGNRLETRGSDGAPIVVHVKAVTWAGGEG